MKKLSLIFMLVAFNTIHAKALSLSVNNKQVSDSITLKAKNLRKLYSLIKAAPSNDGYKKQFFNEFPNTYKQLNDIYGYNSKTNTYAPLEEVYYEHISDLFNNLNNIKDTLYYKKLISIAIGGHWDADAVNAFQEGLRKRVEDNPTLVVNILKKMSNNQIKSFWFFYFDGAHPKKQLSKQIQRVELINKKIYTLLIQAQGQVLKQLH